jgi:hypothetical protein
MNPGVYISQFITVQYLINMKSSVCYQYNQCINHMFSLSFMTILIQFIELKREK